MKQDLQTTVKLRMRTSLLLGISGLVFVAAAAMGFMLYQTKKPFAQNGGMVINILEQKKRQVRDIEVNLVGLSKVVSSSTEHIRPIAIEKFSILATQRRLLLQQIRQQDASTFSAILFPKAVVDTFDPEIRSLVEQHVMYEGTLLVIHEDNLEQSKTNTLLQLKTSEQTYTLVPNEPNALDNLRGSNKTVVVSGIVLEPKSTELFILDPKIDIVEVPNQVAEEENKQESSDRNIAVFLVNFSDDQHQPWTGEYIEDVLTKNTDSLKAYTIANSLGELTITTKISPDWITLPLTTCAWNDIFAATVAKVNAGFDFQPFNTVMIFFPKQNRGECFGWNGSATVGPALTNPDGGGDLSVAWFNGSSTLLTVGHEFGHTLGADHASALSCTGDPVYGNCQDWEYGDLYSIMGAAYTASMNGYHKSLLAGIRQPLVQDITESGTYSLLASNSNEKGMHAFRIPKTTDNRNGEVQEWYIIEHRMATGFDTVIDNLAPNSNGLFVYTVHAEDHRKTHLIDMTPGSANGFWDAALPIGQQFTDTQSGLRLMPEKKSEDELALQVTLPPAQPCQEAAPSLQITGPSKQIRFGESASFEFQLTNKNSWTCGTGTFKLDLAGPTIDQWFTRVSPATPSVAPSKTVSGQIHFYPFLSSPGNHQFTLSIKNPDHPDLNVQVQLTLYVDASDSLAPIVVITNPPDGATVSGTFQLRVEATDNIGLVQGAKLIFTFPNGQIFSVVDPRATFPYTLPINTSYNQNGLHRLRVEVSDFAGNVGFDEVSFRIMNTSSQTQTKTAPGTLQLSDFSKS